MWFGILTLATALIISVSAAYYSILGLTAIFAAAFWPIVILGSSLEVGKIVSTLWLHKYWHRAELQYKVYLCAAVAILMLLTSMGVFGFLSKAHSDQSLVSGDVIAKISIYDEKIKQARDNIDMARKALTQMDSAVDQTMSRSTTETGADKAAQLRRSQATERNRLLKEIDAEQKKIQALNDQAAPIRAEVRKVEAEVGPIKYIAALIYGDNPEANVLEKAVRWVIILIVIVFDPLALTLLLAATKSIEWERGVNIMSPTARRKPENYPNDDDPEVKKFFDKLKEKAQAMDRGIYEALTPQEQKLAQEVVWEEDNPNPYQDIKPDANHWYDHIDEPEPIKKQTVLSGLESMWSRAKKLVVKDSESEHAPLEQKTNAEIEGDEQEKEARRRWKEANPNDTIHHQEKLHSAGKISRLPWHESDLVADNHPLGYRGEVKGFGTSFPKDPNKGDMFLRVDHLPSVLYKYNGANWIEVDKTLSDQHAYDDAYIDHLIEKISTGEYDPDLLSDAERDRIEERLQKTGIE
jgi:hypothetical protein